jgi:uroporphyrinogen decarboxylase
MDIEDKVKLFNAVLLIIEELDVDGITLRAFPASKLIDNEHVRDDWGVTFQLSEAGEATVVDGPIKSESDLNGFKPPNIKEADLLALSYCAERFKGERALVLSFQCPFRKSWNLVGGMENLFYAYVENPGLVRHIARLITDYTLEGIELGIKLGADIISLDGDLAHNTDTIISPRHFNEYVKPYYAEIVNYVHKQGLKVFKHTDGNHMRIFQDLIDVGFNGIHPIQPQCMDIAEVKGKYGGSICLLGNIDCMETLVSRSVADVEDEVRRVIANAAPGGGYILTSSNTIHPGVKAENYIAMVKAAHMYGMYGDHGKPVNA